MKILLNILKAFLINISFIGIIFAANSCPSIHPNNAKDLPVEQAEAILGDILCSFIDLHTEGNKTFFSTLSLTKKKIIPYIDLEYSTELALGDYWKQLQPKDKKIFERDIKATLINEYINSLVNMENWEHLTITVDKNFSKINNLAEVKIDISDGFYGDLENLINENIYVLNDDIKYDFYGHKSIQIFLSKNCKII